MILHLFAHFLAVEFGVLRGHEAASARHRDKETLAFKVFIGVFGCDDADAQLFGQKPDAGQRIPFLEFAGQDLILDLPRDLRVDRLLPGI